MSLKLAARLVALYPQKIADLQENDTAAHEFDLSPFVPPASMAILIICKRISGTGFFDVYPMLHPTNTHRADNISVLNMTITTIKDQTLKWSNTVNNDDWDLWLYGYFVQKRTR